MNLHIPNKELLNKKIKKIKKDSNDNLHIIADFDGTITKSYLDGKKINTAIAQIRDGDYLEKDYAKRAYSLYDKYHPYEIDKKISLKEKKEKMLEWWSTHIKLLTECGMNKKVVEDIIKKDEIILRENSQDFFDILYKQDIPILIFSSAVGDIIEGFLKSKGRLYKNTYIISNFFEYDENGNINGYKTKIIHSLNKNEGHLINSPYYDKIKNRKNVLLLGDSLGDINMLDGVEHNTVIKIGFLNKRLQESLDSYSEKYDVIITDDGPMDYVNELLKKIIK